MARRVGAVFTSNVRLKLKRLEGDMQKHLLDHMIKSAEDVAELARLNVPVDTFTVEDSIIVEKPRRDGINFAYTFTVGVNTNKFNSIASQRKRNWNANKFAYFDVWLHESTYSLGERSIAKNLRVQSESPYARVGNKFLTRASESLDDDINRAASTIVKNIARRHNR